MAPEQLESLVVVLSCTVHVQLSCIVAYSLTVS